MKKDSETGEKMLIPSEPPIVEEETFSKPDGIKPISKTNTLPMKHNASEELNFDLGSFIATILDESLNKDIVSSILYSLP